MKTCKTSAPRLSKLLLPAAFAAALLATPARAVVVHLQPGETASKDAEINTVIPGQNNNSNMLIINWGFAEDDPRNGEPTRSVGLLQFDLSGLSEDATVNTAELTLYQAVNSFNSGIQYDIFRITSDWNENTVTFNSAPTFDPVAVASLTIPDNNVGVFRSWDITGLAQGWVNGDFANYGMWIEEVPIEGPGTAYFSSSSATVGFTNEAAPANRPMLSLDFNGEWTGDTVTGSGTEEDPFLPISDATPEVFDFTFNVVPQQIRFIDPVIAIGYDYVVSSGPNIATVLLPTIASDDGQYEIYLWDGDGYDTLAGIAQDGVTFDFTALVGYASGVDRFRVLGIDQAALLDPALNTAFVTGLTFVSGGTVVMSQTAVTFDTDAVNPGPTDVPEPATMSLLGAGLAGVAWARRRKVVKA